MRICGIRSVVLFVLGAFIVLLYLIAASYSDYQTNEAHAATSELRVYYREGSIDGPLAGGEPIQVSVNPGDSYTISCIRGKAQTVSLPEYYRLAKEEIGTRSVTIPDQGGVVEVTFIVERSYYTVTFLDAGRSPFIQYVMADEGNIASLPPISPKENYIFNGWNTQNDGNGEDFTPETKITNDLVVYAQWSILYSSVTFDLNGGQGHFNTLSLPAGSWIAQPNTVPSKEGFFFAGWNSARDGSGKQWNFATMPVSNKSITLYAQYQQLTPHSTPGVSAAFNQVQNSETQNEAHQQRVGSEFLSSYLLEDSKADDSTASFEQNLDIESPLANSNQTNVTQSSSSAMEKNTWSWVSSILATCSLFASFVVLFMWVTTCRLKKKAGEGREGKSFEKQQFYGVTRILRSIFIMVGLSVAITFLASNDIFGPMTTFNPQTVLVGILFAMTLVVLSALVLAEYRLKEKV